jgi:hypothetical protein
VQAALEIACVALHTQTVGRSLASTLRVARCP